MARLDIWIQAACNCQGNPFRHIQAKTGQAQAKKLTCKANAAFSAQVRTLLQAYLQFFNGRVIEFPHSNPASLLAGQTRQRLILMNATPATISGYVVALPRNVDPRQAIVAIIQNDVEYRILPRGAGVDLADEVNAMVEATGLTEEKDGITYLAVRGYKVLEDDGWEEE